MLPGSKFFLFREGPFTEGSLCAGNKQEVTKVVFLVKHCGKFSWNSLLHCGKCSWNSLLINNSVQIQRNNYITSRLTLARSVPYLSEERLTLNSSSSSSANNSCMAISSFNSCSSAASYKRKVEMCVCRLLCPQLYACPDKMPNLRRGKTLIN